ncbi:MAG: kelch repeat-containing protein, partial [Elusimicrobiota bacterium]
IEMSPELASASVIAGTITINGGSITQNSSYTATLNGGNIGIPAGSVIDTSGYLTFTARARSLAGIIDYTGSGGAQAFTGAPMAVPQTGSQALTSLTATMEYVASPMSLAEAAFRVDVATIVIRSMVFGQAEFYYPKANQATFAPPNGSIAASTAIAAFGHTTTLLPNTDVFVAGGFDCTGAACASFTAKNNAGIRSDLILLPSAVNFSATPGSLLTPRAFHTATLLPNDTILVAGGTNGPSLLASAEIFNPAAGTFSPANGPLRNTRDHHTATLLPNGRVLLAGGFTTNAASTASTNSAEIYYPDTKLFIPTSLMISSRSNHTATLMPDGNVIVVGGFGDNDIITGTAEIYYSTSGAWKPLASSTARKQHTATLLKDGRLMTAGGVNSGGVLNTVQAYTPTTNSWAALSPLPVALHSHTATLLFDGRVLVVGGNNGSGEVNASYIYDPGADSWVATAASPLSRPRFGHTATLLPDGSVMISGGSTVSGAVPTGIEVYRIDASSWVPTSNSFAGGARAFHTMTLAADGNVYAIGGSNGLIGGAGTSLFGPGEHRYFTNDADVYTKNAPPSIRRSTITSTSATPLPPGATLSVNGLQFRGGTEASGGGSGAANSSFSFPQMILQKIDGTGFAVDLTTEICKNTANQASLDTSLSVALPPVAARLPTGWYNARISANGVYSKAVFLQAGPDKPTLPPGVASGTAVGISSMLWTWSNIGGLVDGGYNIYQATSGIFLGTAPAVTNPFFFQTNLSPNTTCSILVAGFSITGDGPLAASSTHYPPSALPVNIAIASVTSSDLLLQWNANGNTPGTIYEVSMSTDYPSYASFNSIPVPFSLGLTNNFATIGQLQANTRYAFRVRAFNAAGLPSPYGVYASTLTRISVSVVSGNATALTSIRWQWSPSPGVLSYRVFNATTGAQIYETPPFTPPDEAPVTFLDVGLATNTARSIQVAAYTTAGLGPLSNAATVYTYAATPLPNSPPITNLSTGSFVIGWRADDGNPGGTQYKATIGMGAVIISTFYSTGYPYTLGVTGLLPSQNYTINLYALNGDGIASAALVIGSTDTLPLAPTTPVRVADTPNSISIAWTANGNPPNVIYQ